MHHCWAWQRQAETSCCCQVLCGRQVPWPAGVTGNCTRSRRAAVGWKCAWRGSLAASSGARTPVGLSASAVGSSRAASAAAFTTLYRTRASASGTGPCPRSRSREMPNHAHMSFHSLQDWLPALCDHCWSHGALWLAGTSFQKSWVCYFSHSLTKKCLTGRATKCVECWLECSSRTGVVPTGTMVLYDE